ncbi:pyruvate, phosphate dikinase [Paraburkholderia kururiensis]|uniref:pyruvate, phosphate dikinase n=1 Tax=Paraburkholderia kururiensis TaxID=984307 RepID=UPI00036CEF1F|nr:pyruvate, phosphate dikinase [Paraburkholderia kururiensis]
MAVSFGSWVLGLDGGDFPAKELIGAKAWSIGQMSALGLNVPPAFVVTTRACREFMADETKLGVIEDEIAAGMAWLEARTGRTFGGGPIPLLVSVRSGAAVSMPGMMDTILNVGISTQTEALLATLCRNADFARDIHCRFLDLFGRLVLEAPVEPSRGDDPAAWRDAFAQAGRPVPEDVTAQLSMAVRAVFRSWNSRRARRYRAHHGIADDAGTAVLIQAMVFGNRDERSGTGVLFSRNPLTGEATPYGEFLACAQGEDIVSGKVTPHRLAAMRSLLPEAFEGLLSAARSLERANGDMQDIEFTVESGELFLLQARAGKRSPEGAARMAVDMLAEGLISPDAALSRVTPEQMRSCLRPRLAGAAAEQGHALLRGEAASPGLGWGVVVMDPDEAERRARLGEDVVLARVTTSPDDLHGMIAARAVITEHGGSTSHAAVVGRALGRPCVVGCGGGVVAGLVGRVVTVDGSAGAVYDGRLPVVTPDEEDDPVLQRLCRLAEAHAPIAVHDESREAADVDVSSLTDLDALCRALGTLPPGATVRGPIFANDHRAVGAAIDAGVAGIITRPRLPALLAAIRHVREHAPAVRDISPA